MDEQDSNYVKGTPPLEEPTRGHQITTLRSILVHENYTQEAQKQLNKSKRASGTSTKKENEQELNVIQKKSTPNIQKKFDQRWYHFYNRQVFSLGQVAAGEDERPATPSIKPTQLLKSTSFKLQQPATRIPPETQEENSSELIPRKHRSQHTGSWTSCPRTNDIYKACFDTDWETSGVDKVIRDAVERNRVHGMLRSHARILFHLFRLYSSMNGASDRDPFKLASKAKFFEDLSIIVIEPARHGISIHSRRLNSPSIDDQPIGRSAFLHFLVNVALGYFKRDEVASLLKRLIKDGLEISSCVHYLLQDFILPFASIEDPVHFLHLFNQPSIQQLLQLYKAGLQAAFLHHAEPITQDPLTPSGTESDQTPEPYMKFQSFLIFLHYYKLIDAKFTESRASVIFCSCLAVWPDCNAIVSRAIDYNGFTVALAKVVFAKHEKAICNGEEDLCPARPLSQRCQCIFDEIKSTYNLAAFIDPLTAIVSKVAAPGIKRGGRRRSLANAQAQL